MRDDYIWRLEFADGSGPYQGERNVAKWVRELELNKGDLTGSISNRAGAKGDRILLKLLREYEDLSDYHYGFSDIHQYRRWFELPEVREMLEEKQLLLVRYDGPESTIVHGDTQSIFIRNQTEITAVCSPTKDPKAEITADERARAKDLKVQRRSNSL